MFELFEKSFRVRLFIWACWLLGFLWAAGYFIAAIKWW